MLESRLRRHPARQQLSRNPLGHLRLHPRPPHLSPHRERSTPLVSRNCLRLPPRLRQPLKFRSQPPLSSANPLLRPPKADRVPSFALSRSPRPRGQPPHPSSLPHPPQSHPSPSRRPPPQSPAPPKANQLSLLPLRRNRPSLDSVASGKHLREPRRWVRGGSCR